MELPLPVAESGQAPREDDATPYIVINLLESGEILVAGRSIPLEALESRLRSLQVDRETTEVKIRAHRQVIYRHVEPLMMACHQSGIRKVTYSVYRSRDVR
jgi:biopolymer transport protein ExbD